MNNVNSKEYEYFKKSVIKEIQLTQLYLDITVKYLELLKVKKLPLDEETSSIMKEITYEERDKWMFETTVSRAVGAFKYYLSQILLKIFIRQPNIFKASEYKADIKEFIEAGSVPEFIRRFSEKKVDELGFEGLAKIIEYLNKRLGLQFKIEPSIYESVSELLEVRNIIEHNRGFISRIYLERTGRTDVSKGDTYPMTSEYVSDSVTTLVMFVKQLDAQIVTHFKLHQEND